MQVRQQMVRASMCQMGLTYILDKVTWVTEGRLLRVCNVSWVRWGTVPKCVYSRHPGTSRECCPVMPSPFKTPSRLFPWTTRDNSSFILLPAIRVALCITKITRAPTNSEVVRIYERRKYQTMWISQAANLASLPSRVTTSRNSTPEFRILDTTFIRLSNKTYVSELPVGWITHAFDLRTLFLSVSTESKTRNYKS